MINTIFSALHATGRCEGGEKRNSNFTSEARAQLEAAADPFFHNFTPGFQPAPPLLGLKDPRVTGAFLKIERRWAGARAPAGGEETGRKLRLRARPGLAHHEPAMWFIGPRPACVRPSACSYRAGSSRRNYFYKPAQRRKGRPSDKRKVGAGKRREGGGTRRERTGVLHVYQQGLCVYNSSLVLFPGETMFFPENERVKRILRQRRRYRRCNSGCRRGPGGSGTGVR